MSTNAEMEDCYMCGGSGYIPSSIGAYKECSVCKGTGRIRCNVSLDNHTK